MAVNKNIYYGGFVLVVLAALSYIFWGADLIPDAVSNIAPLTFLGWIDDAVVLVGMIFILSKWKNITLGGPNTKGLGIKGALIFIPIIVLTLGYTFWIVDIIPDTIPIAGYVDDVVGWIMGLYILGKIRKRLKS